MPPAFQYSDNREEATARAQDVLRGKATSISTPEREFTEQGVALPNPGDMSIICDGDGMPVALISDTNIYVDHTAHGPVVVEDFDVLYPR